MSETPEQATARRKARSDLSLAMHRAHANGVSWASMQDLLNQVRAHYDKIWTIDDMVKQLRPNDD